jgi:hypothetical protein
MLVSIRRFSLCAFTIPMWLLKLFWRLAERPDCLLFFHLDFKRKDSSEEINRVIAKRPHFAMIARLINA